MKALILYFSGTGNTAYVAKLIGETLKEFEIEAEIVSTEDNYTACADTYDLLILGCPKYYEYPPLDFIDYIKKNLPVCSRTIPTLMFLTQAGTLGTSFKGMERLLARKNYRLIIGKSFAFANNMMIFSMFTPTDDKTIQAHVDEIRGDIVPLLQSFLKGDVSIESVGFFMRKFEKFVAVLCTKLFPTFGMKYSTSDECTGCGLCAQKCPKNNIVMSTHRPKFGKHCLFCMRCINSCPSNAILYNKKRCNQYNRNTTEIS